MSAPLTDEQRELARAWSGPLEALADSIREAARTEMARALEQGTLEHVSRPVAEGAGDVTYGLDLRPEELLSAWLVERAREGPLSLLTEDAGWRHMGPGADGTPTTLADFDHGGPRIAVDPVDGTRNLMNDLRSAWTVISFAGPGSEQPRMTDLSLGLVGEIPDSRAACYRMFRGVRDAGAEQALRRLDDRSLVRGGPLVVDEDDRPDDGYFPFFAYMPNLRPRIAEIGARFFERLERLEGADPRNCYDDQYISSGGQLVLLSLGTYRSIVDARALVARRDGSRTTTAKPYDLAGAVVIAREAGCVVVHPEGGELDFPIDAVTPVDFAGFANGKTAERLLPHLLAALVE